APVTDVDVVVRVLAVVAYEFIPLPSGRRLLTEEAAGHVVVDTHDQISALTVELCGFGPDEACGTGDENGRHPTLAIKSFRQSAARAAWRSGSWPAMSE